MSNTNPNLKKQMREGTFFERVVYILKDNTFRERLQSSLSGTNVQADRFIRTAISAISQNEKILERCTPSSIGSAVLRAASMTLDLDPVLGHAYLVPRGGQATLQISYRGRMELARRSGQLVAMDVGTIHKNDNAKLTRGTKPELTIGIPLDGDRGPILGYYCAAQWKDGGSTVEYMPIAEIVEHRNKHSDEWKRRGQASVWGVNFDAMAKKTVIVRASKTWPIVAIPDEDELPHNTAYNQNGTEIIDANNNVDTSENITKKLNTSSRLNSFVTENS